MKVKFSKSAHKFLQKLGNSDRNAVLSKRFKSQQFLELPIFAQFQLAS
ncbi:MAG: hypothetical protein ACO37W_14360 [Prochlorotrichaceae cyanobacterium]